MNLYKSKDEIVEEMLADYESITGIKLSIKDLGFDQVIKIHTFAGGLSMFYADLQKVSNEIHPQSASEAGLIKHQKSRKLPDMALAQSSVGKIKHTGEVGKLVPAGSKVKRKIDGISFISTEAGVIDGSGEVEVLYQSATPGQEFNIEEVGQDFTLESSIDGIDADCINSTAFSDGRDKESPSSLLERVEQHDRRENSGGNLVSYEKWAREASSQVVKAKSYKHPRGNGTVDTVITSGTTDIDAAVENGDAVIRIPSDELISIVQAYILEEDPTTDNHLTIKPTEEFFDMSINFELHDETLRPIVVQEIEKICKKFIYKLESSEVFYTSDIEKLIDSSLSNLIKYRRVADFDAKAFYQVPDKTILVPNDITFTGGDV